MPSDQRTNRAAVLLKPGQLEIQELEMPVVGPSDVLVEIVVTGICGTDLHQYTSGGVGAAVIAADSPGFVMGHESAGLVVEVGSQVSSVKVGDRVAIEPGFPCKNCKMCSRQLPNMCLNLKYMSLPPTNGSLCQYWAGPEENAVKIPGNVSWEQAGCIQPLAVAVELGRRAQFKPGGSVAIFGCGPLGLLISAVAKASGCSDILMFDISPERVAFARQFYATYACLTPPKLDGEEDLVYARRWTQVLVAAGVDTIGVDYTCEASGQASCMQAGCAILCPGGTLIQAGLGPSLQLFPTFDLVARGLNVLGTVRFTDGCFADAIEMIASGKIDLAPLITKSYPLTQIEQAILDVKKGKDIKIVIWNQK